MADVAGVVSRSCGKGGVDDVDDEIRASTKGKTVCSWSLCAAVSSASHIASTRIDESTNAAALISVSRLHAWSSFTVAKNSITA